MKIKSCFTCKRKYPLIFFHTDNSTYQLKSNKGKVVECRFCVLKRSKTQKGLMQRINGKFEFTNINNFKYFFKR
jgi:hypothetical protein